MMREGRRQIVERGKERRQPAGSKNRQKVRRRERSGVVPDAKMVVLRKGRRSSSEDSPISWFTGAEL
jgi:hypothetical protein